MLLVLAFSSLIGVALGLLGGGGSMLTVPILVYGLGLEPKPAIATSLLVVGLTSSAALYRYARLRLVDFRTGLLFGGAAMIGAFAGGHLASFLSGSLLLVGFSIMMFATAIAMIRGCKDELPGATEGSVATLSIARILGYGVIVGALTGLVGAGGGFMIVPALVLLGGMSMRTAIATSLLVIAMKSFAGFAGYIGHVPVDWKLAALVAAAAVVGSISGTLLSARLPQTALRRSFAWFAMVMAVFILSRQLPEAVTRSDTFRAVFVERWPFWVGGIALGAFVLFMLWADNKLLGVSTGCSELCAIARDSAVRSSWRLRFLGGIVLGGALAGLLAGRHMSFSLGAFDELFGNSPSVKVPVLLGAGVLIGYGARAAGGCTSGHGIVGTALGAKSSWVATCLFMVGGFITTFAIWFLAG